MSNPEQREKRYQAIRLYHSGLISLSDLKAQFRMVATLADDEYTSTATQKDVLATKERLDRLEKMTMTRDQAKLRYLMKMQVKPKLARTRDEEIAQFATSSKFGIPHNWSRYGTLIKRTDKVNKPRPGTAKRHIVPNRSLRVIGFKEFNKSYDKMMKALLNLTRDKKGRSQFSKALRSVKDNVRVSTSKGKY